MLSNIVTNEKQDIGLISCIRIVRLGEEEAEMDKQGKRCRRRVVLVPCPFQGHINPMLQLGTILHSKGFSVTIIHTQFNSPNPSSHPELIFLPIPDDLLDQEIASGNLMIVRQDSDDEIACIIYDELMYFSEAVASQMKLPSMILRTISAATFISRVVLLQIQEGGSIPFPDAISLDPVPELSSLRFKDLPISKFGLTNNYLQLISHACDIKTASAVIWNTMDCLEEPLLAKQQEKQFPIPIFKIGPIHKFAPALSSSLLNEETSCITWLDKQIPNSVLYIGLGSVASIDETELAEMACGLANSKQPFLWVIRPGSIHGSEWIELLPEGHIVKWAPQREVLAHPAVGVFWSHCGWNSTLESISEGVPMICRPCFGDQRVTARYASHVWRIGLQLENKLERQEIESTIRRLMVDEEGEGIRLRAKDLKENVEICFRKGGSSYNSLNKLVEFMSSL
ncbi:UDP-glucuronosyltransferase, putative [Ricinus communis]|uniref:UDP-glucuronosyltransferase, putative n=1 Tax=Ricinus communis TaxID=3988 RepID=B9S396_RICCO|nr:UDP-glucuronosyltransferase, putative [Ricinus communis]